MLKDITPHTALSDTLQFLVVCCKIDRNEEDIEFIYSFIQHSTSNIQNLLALANVHGVLPLVYKTIKNLSQANSHFLSELKAHYISISQSNMLMSAELIRIMKLLEDNGIEAFAFKGPTLSQVAYGDITLRQFGDLDILIRHYDITHMIDLFLAEGYTPQIDLDTNTKETVLDALTVIGFYKNKSDILIEVHWQLLSKNYAIAWDEATLWDYAQENVAINTTPIRVLPSQEQLLYLCIHGSKHLFERLEWVCDIDRYVRAYPHMDWSQLLNIAKKRGVQRMLFLGLALSQHLFRLELPELMRTHIAQDKVVPKLISEIIKANFLEMTQEGKSYGYFILMWHMRENLSDKLRFLWRAFFAAQLDDFTYIRLPRSLVFLYPLVRQFRLITKYFNR